ncbi:MAG TPA: 4-aminobutyrate--2-oxoglutarate transaminase [Dongiaceae bacterium]|nr:4-aminobutyrate--2-oxoglutarate transaminase [Dongiaceae bacterium]
MSRNAELNKRRMNAIPRAVAASAVYAKSAKNAEIFDEDGRRLIDFGGGIAVLNVGHCHPKVIEAARRQLDAVTHTCFQVTPYETYVRLAERLNKLTPGMHAKKTIFLTTGAEAIENAVKIARAHTKRPGVIAFSGAFHGRTLLGMALTGKTVPYKVGFGPFPADIYHVAFPHRAEQVPAALEALETLFRADIAPEHVAAIVIEPVQGEGGFNIVPFELMRALREICTKHGIVFIVDEIQTGFARTGRMFAIEHSGVIPDLMAVAKSLAGGFPLSAVVGRAEIMDAPGPGGLGGTYAGNPVACAAANAVLDVIEEEGLVERANQLGKFLITRLQQMKGHNRVGAHLGDIRGLGAMIAVEIVKEGGAPDADLTKAVVLQAQQNGLILLSCGINGNVLRFLMPLTTSDKLVAEGMDILERSLAECVGSTARVA